MLRLLLFIFTLLNICLLSAQSTQELFRKAEFAYCDHNIPLAIKHLKSYRNLPKYDLYKVYINTKLGDLYLEQNDTAQAINYYTKALDDKLVKPFPNNTLSCSFSPLRSKRTHINVCFKLSNIYRHKKEHYKAENYLNLIGNKYRVSYGCALDMAQHAIRTEIEQAKIDLLKGDTIIARNSMLDLIFTGHSTDQVKTTLYTSVKDRYSKKELQHQVLTGIKEGYIDQEHKYYIMTFFDHNVKNTIDTSESKETIIKRLLKRHLIKEILK